MLSRGFPLDFGKVVIFSCVRSYMGQTADQVNKGSDYLSPPRRQPCEHVWRCCWELSARVESPQGHTGRWDGQQVLVGPTASDHTVVKTWREHTTYTESLLPLPSLLLLLLQIHWHRWRRMFGQIYSYRIFNTKLWPNRPISMSGEKCCDVENLICYLPLLGILNWNDLWCLGPFCV